MAENESGAVASVPLLTAQEREKFLRLLSKLKEALPEMGAIVHNMDEWPPAAVRALAFLDEGIHGLDRWMEDHLSAAFRARDLAGENERLRESGVALAAALRGWHEMDDGQSPVLVSEQKALIARAERDAAGSILHNADDADMIGEWSRQRFEEALDGLGDEIQGRPDFAFRFAITGVRAYAEATSAEGAEAVTNNLDELESVVQVVREKIVRDDPTP